MNRQFHYRMNLPNSVMCSTDLQGAWPMSKNALPMTVTIGVPFSVSFLVERM
jgi:hypothetical protein